MTRISDIHALLAGRKISCAELTGMYLDACKRFNREINAYITLTEGDALEAARRVDEKLAT
ncbi:MAG: Asp-tRNA(Asn)/Glu-tRNA(Gln) amidotransferase subunit GatA, partial [Oscillospiraceae bacterium]|nr:Asp-tRNA(Asn)/Glu-tRNA(Gln) amidotransferase subunit GatA [Oscillospiraceae bacterium]